MKRNLKTRLISILAVLCVIIGILPAQAADTYAISITANTTNWDNGHNFHNAGNSTYLAMQMNNAAITSAEKPWVEYFVYAEEAGPYKIEFKTSPLADGKYTSPADFSVNGNKKDATLKQSIDVNTKIYETIVTLDAGKNVLRFDITGPRPNIGTDGLFHIYYINCEKYAISTLRFEGEGAKENGRDYTSTWYYGSGHFIYSQTDSKTDIAAGNRWWKHTFNAPAGRYKFTWKSTDTAGSQYVSPVKLTVNGTEVTAKTKELANDNSMYIHSNEVYLVDGINEVKFLMTATKNFGQGSNGLVYIDYVEFEYLDNNAIHGSLKYDDIGGNANGTQYYGGKAKQMFTSATVNYTLDIPAGKYDMYVGACSSVFTNYLGTLAFKIGDNEYTDFTSSNVSDKKTFSSIGGHFKYNETLELTGKESITFQCSKSAVSGSNNYILFDYFELVPQEAEIGNAELTVEANKMACGDTMQAESELYYTTGFVCNESKNLGAKYASSNTDVATIDANGLITAKNPGVAKISVTYNGKYTDSTDIFVYNESGIVPVSTSYNAENGKAKIDFISVTDDATTPSVFFGAYENGALLGAELVEEVALERGRITSVEKNITGDKVKAFVWDGANSLMPLLPVVDLKSENDIFEEYVDFVVDVPEGREPVILHLADTQIIDSAQRRTSGRISASAVEYWATDRMDELCFDYLREVVTETNPDLILLTGDIVYGEFDDNGTAFEALIDVMESLDTPWAPVFGNHDNESVLGVDWQCARLEAAPNCLFKQRTLTGNGNYSVGIAQGGELKRVFFMLDSNGGTNKSAKTLANGHSVTTTGFGDDQIAWYTSVANKINEELGVKKYSLAYHIHQYIFNHGYDKYSGYEPPVNLAEIQDEVEKAPGTDFGYIGKTLDNGWNTSISIYKDAKAFGCDSHFVGHEHAQSASITYDGTLLQFGQKSSAYDSLNWKDSNGNVVNGSCLTDATPMVGGTVLKMNEDGSFGERYIHYCDSVIEE